jgi:YggT family protein
MDFTLLIQLIRLLAQIFTWIVIASALLSFFVPPYHPVREALDRIVEPFLNPIRRVVPMAGMFDFSPLILLFAIELVSRVLIAILLSLS